VKSPTIWVPSQRWSIRCAAAASTTARKVALLLSTNSAELLTALAAGTPDCFQPSAVHKLVEILSQGDTLRSVGYTPALRLSETD